VYYRKKAKQQERFYLFPGQGGKNYYRKQRVFLSWAVAVALLFGSVLALAMWWIARYRI